MTARDAIRGVESAWGSPAALGAVCACGARGEHHRCAGRPPQTNGGRPTPGAHDLRATVLEALRTSGALSGNGVVRAVGRRRGQVLAVLRQLERDGAVRRNGDGWTAT